MSRTLMQKYSREDYYKIYAKAHNNAGRFLTEAELLYKHKHYARAYFLAFTGLEEISKSQLAADVYTGFIEEKGFWARYAKHQEKINRVQWASHDAENYPDEETEEYVSIHSPELAKRMDALYVGVTETGVQSPEEVITPAEAKSLIHTLKSAMESIFRAEFYGERIGTKGFLK